MGKLVMITGGARSGKSRYAEKLVSECGENALYIATSIAFDDEMRDRVKKHREQRPHNWSTLEAYKTFDKVLESECTGVNAALLDCLTIMVTNNILEHEVDWDSFAPEIGNAIEKLVMKEVEILVDTVKRLEVPFYIVTNELGMGVVPETSLGRYFRDVAGRVNQYVAAAAEEVYLCVSGIPIKIKG